MNQVLKKLGYKSQQPVLIVNAPPEYSQTANEIPAEIHTSANDKTYSFIQIFVQSMNEAHQLVAQTITHIADGGHFWLCYPKQSSKKYKTDINRDKSCEALAPFQFEPVSLVAIDDDWSALRFKPVDAIKTMKRQSASSQKGKERIEKQSK